MNDLLFFVADADMREAIAGFFGRDAVERIVGCHRIDFDPRRDIRVCHEHDPGLYVRANEFLRPFEGAYRHVVLLIDAGQTKPRMPKEAAEWALRQRKVRRSPALYGQIARAVSIRRCEDPALARLLEALRAWFPGESEASRGE